MYVAEFLTVALIHLLAVASPGPDFAVQLAFGGRFGRLRAQGLEADVQQVRRRRPFQCVK